LEELGIISADEAKARISNLITTLNKLDKWNGLFSNYYDVVTLKSDSQQDKFISTVDNGWLATGLIVASQTFADLKPGLDLILNAMQFGELYNSIAGQLSIGYDPTTSSMAGGVYGLIYTEIRPTLLIAIGKGDIPSAVWGRMTTAFPGDWTWQAQIPVNGTYEYNVNGKTFHYIPSWNGTMFEALGEDLDVSYFTFGETLHNRFARSATWEGMATETGECTPKLTDYMTDGGWD